MTELIDRQRAITEIESCFCSECDCGKDKSMCGKCEYLYCIDILQQQPTIEAEPVRHGRWILCKYRCGVDNDNNSYAYFCSQCHYQDVHSKFAKVNFCWNCGAKMLTEPPESEVQE